MLTLASILSNTVGDLVTQPAPSGGGTERIGIVWKSGGQGALVLPFPGVSTDRDIPGRGRFFGPEDTPESQPNIEMLRGGSGVNGRSCVQGVARSRQTFAQRPPISARPCSIAAWS